MSTAYKHDNRFADPAPAPDRQVPVALSIIVPTYNERANIGELVSRVAATLTDVAWEIIVVDDNSPDGTADHVRDLHALDPRVRVIQRIGRRGLSSACIEGMLSSSAPVLAVMDGDLQHDPALLAGMYRAMRSGETDLVVASRYVAGGALGEWAHERAVASKIATKLARSLTGVELTDPMSGYFMLRREVIDEHAPALSGIGFKILLDIVLSCRDTLRIRELPLVFGVRRCGVSKLSPGVAWEYILLLADKLLGHIVPVRFFAFAAVGALGVLIHLSVLALMYMVLDTSFLAAQASATAVAIVGNFTINNILTYSDRTLHGWRWFRGLASFAAICAVGAFANVGVAGFLFGHHALWPVAAAAGIAASAVWNYGVSAQFTWGRGR